MTNTNFAVETDLHGRLVRATNFVLDHWWIWPLALLALWIALKIRAVHALLAQLDERADAAFGDVDALLIERKGLIGNLVEVVRAFAAHEHGIIRDVLEGRIGALSAISGAIRNESQIAGVLQNLFSVTEQYPALAASAHFARLRDDLVRIEDRITAARRFYNLAVEEANSARQSFPGNLLPAKAAPREKFSLGERRAEFAEPVSISL